MSKKSTTSHLFDRSQDGNRRQQRSFLRLAIAATAILALFLLFKRDNLINWVQARITIASQERHMEQNRRTIEALDAHISLLTEDKDSLERYAREKYHFARTGDDVYIAE